MTKAELRQQMRRLAAGLDPARRAGLARRAQTRLLRLPEARAARCVFLYISVGSEIDTAALVEHLLSAGVTVAAPRILPRFRLEAVPFDDPADLVPGAFGIPAPRPDLPALADHNPPDLAVVPGLAFTPQGDRLGAGGGYYDRYLAQHPAVTPVALAYDHQLLRTIPTAPHDQPVTAIVTPTQTYRRGSGSIG